MSYESAKANRRRVNDPLWRRVFSGVGIDIGAGNDPVAGSGQWDRVVSCETFDVDDGDANYITRYRPKEGYDFVHSSHCLEHMRDPVTAMKEWWALVKPGGYLAVVVPDEDLYEQGCWPSRFNPDHKWTFTIHKPSGCSWSPCSINVIELIFESLVSFRLLSLRIVNSGYNYELTELDQTGPPYEAEAGIEWVAQKVTKPRDSLDS